MVDEAADTEAGEAQLVVEEAMEAALVDKGEAGGLGDSADSAEGSSEADDLAVEARAVGSG